MTLPDYMFTTMCFINNFKHVLLLLSGDIEINPGPKRSSNIRFCYWNLNGLAAHDFIEVPFVEAFSGGFHQWPIWQPAILVRFEPLK